MKVVSKELLTYVVLKKHFGQKQVLINAHTDALLKILSATNDVKKLRSLCDACEGYWNRPFASQLYIKLLAIT